MIRFTIKVNFNCLEPHMHKNYHFGDNKNKKAGVFS